MPVQSAPPPPNPFPTAWAPHQTAPGWEARQVAATGNVATDWEIRPIQVAVPTAPPTGQVAAINPPESANQPLVNAPSTAVEVAVDPSKVGDRFDAMDLKMLKAVALAEGLTTPKLQEKNMRVFVRNAMRDKAAGIVQSAPVVAPAPVVVVPTPAASSLIPVQGQPGVFFNTATGAMVKASDVIEPHAPPLAQSIPQAVLQHTQAPAAIHPAMVAIPGGDKFGGLVPPIMVHVDPEEEVDEEPVEDDESSEGFSLYIDCLPQKTTKRIVPLAALDGIGNFPPAHGTIVLVNRTMISAAEIARLVELASEVVVG